MKTGLDMVNDVFGLVDVTEVKGLINGVVIRYRRPKQSKKVDVVVNSLLLNAEPLQAGIVNVNVHAPNKVGVAFGGVTDDQQPDLELLGAVSGVIATLLDARWPGGDFHTDIDDAEPLQDTDGTWYMNIRVNYYSVINNFQNT